MIAFLAFFTIWETFPFSELHSPTQFSTGLHDYNCMPNCKGPREHTPEKLYTKMMQFDVFWCIF